MTYLFQSAFLQALGYAIANSLWQVALLWLVYMLFTNITRLSAARKYQLATGIQVISFTWFIFTFQFYYSQYSQLIQDQSGLNNLQSGVKTVIASGDSFRSQLINWMIRAESLLPYLSLAYLLLMLVLATRWVMGYRRTQLMRTEGLHKIPVEWRLFVRNTAAQLGIRKEVSIFLSEKITTPLTMGFLKPLILVPLASINHLSVAQLEALLLHELAHIRRYDYLVNILLSVVEISLFFNPFTQLMASAIRKERENSCDDWVLQFQYSAATYAEALLRVAQLQQQQLSPVFAMAAMKEKNELLNRVKRMIQAQEPGFNYRKQLLALLLVTGILSSVAWLNPATPNKPLPAVQQPAAANTAPPAPAHPVAIEPMAVKINNPLFNPAFFMSDALKQEMKQNLQKAAQDIQRVTVENQVVQEAMQTVPGAVLDAFQQIPAALEDAKLSMEKEKINMDQVRADMQKAARELDSLSILAPFLKKSVESGMKATLQQLESHFKRMNLNINKSEKDLQEKQLKLEKEQKRTAIEQQRISEQMSRDADAIKATPGIPQPAEPFQPQDFLLKPVRFDIPAPYTAQIEAIKAELEQIMTAIKIMETLPHQNIPLKEIPMPLVRQLIKAKLRMVWEEQLGKKTDSTKPRDTILKPVEDF